MGSFARFGQIYIGNTGGTGIAQHACVKTKKCALKRNQTYAYDAMNILYTMCSLSAIADRLVQKPSVPTRDVVFTYLDRWCRIHGFDGNNKGLKPVYIIFVVDGRIDPCKISRNKLHDDRQRELTLLRKRISSGNESADEVKRFKKLQHESLRYVWMCMLFACV